MQWMDFVNAIFEAGMAGAILFSVHRILQDRKALGIHWFHIAFPTAWGFWNLAYYPSLGQMFSFWAGISVVAVNCVYLALLFKYGGRDPGMSEAKIREVLDRYVERLEELVNGEPLHPKRDAERQEDLEHCLEMIPTMRAFLDEGRREKVFRWLGFVQGTLRSYRVYTVAEMADHNRPR